jgi:hypothetical protein
VGVVRGGRGGGLGNLYMEERFELTPGHNFRPCFSLLLLLKGEEMLVFEGSRVLFKKGGVMDYKICKWRRYLN